MGKLKKNSSVQIIQEIQALLDELRESLDIVARRGEVSSKKIKPSGYSGASGGIKMLLEDGYFKETRSLPEVAVRLRQEGFNYPRNTISMSLLRAVRGRVLVRLPAEGYKGKEKWVYVIRK